MTRYRHTYPRNNLFSGDIYSDGSAEGASQIIVGYGDDLFITLNNAGGANVITQQRRANSDEAWANIGHEATGSVVHRMAMLADMEYQWVVNSAGASAATLTLQRSVPSSIQYDENQIQQIAYSQGFPQGVTATTFLDSLTQTDLILRWSLARAQAGFWSPEDLALGSNGLIYILNPDTGSGSAGIQTNDPVAGQGTTLSSWIAVGSIGTNVTTSFHNIATPTSLPSDLPSGSANGALQTEIRLYTDAIVVFTRTATAWAEQGRLTVGGGSSSGVTETQVQQLISDAVSSRYFNYFVGEISPAAGSQNFPQANRHGYIVFTTSGAVNNVDVIAGQAWRCTITTGLGAPANWVRDPAHDYPSHDQGTKAQLDAASAWITSFFVTTPGDDFGGYTRTAGGTWTKSYGDGRFQEIATSATYAPAAAALPPMEYRAIYNLRRGSATHQWPDDLPVGYEFTYRVPAFVDGNVLTIQSGNAATVAMLDMEGVASGNNATYVNKAGEFSFRKISDTEIQQFHAVIYDRAASATGL